jgi:hypothetical protein
LIFQRDLAHDSSMTEPDPRRVQRGAKELTAEERNTTSDERTRTRTPFGTSGPDHDANFSFPDG